MAIEWFVTKDGKTKQGPFSVEQLGEMAASGELLATDMVWNQGLSGWQKAERIPGFFKALSAEAVVSKPLAIPAEAGSVPHHPAAGSAIKSGSRLPLSVGTGCLMEI